MKFIDTHCHPQMSQYNSDREEVIKRTLYGGVGMICVGVDFESSEQAIKLAEKHNLDIEWHDSPDQGPSNTAFAAGQVDFHLSGSVTVLASARAEGRRILIVDSNNKATNTLLVRSDSPIKSVAELKGKNVGIFTAPPSQTLSMAIANLKSKGTEISLNDMKTSSAGPPVVLSNLQRGQVDAAEVNEPFATLAVVQGYARILTTIQDEFKALTGGAALATGVAVQEEYAQRNPDTVKDVVRMAEDAKRYLIGHSEVARKWVVDSYKLTDEKAISQVTERMVDAFSLPPWDNTAVANAEKQIQIFVEQGVISKAPTGLIVNKYNP